MNGIFKGDSIYKSGGGGGGYKDGGQLVDGDFIKVENNTISSYDNVSRDPVNFYFEVKDGEVLNSVVELTTAVNATINVYVVKNGFYYLLGNVGGNTVNAGDDYKINITGDSYAIEQVSGGDNTPLLFVNGISYKVALLNDVGLAFTAENLNDPLDGSYVYANDQENRKNGFGLLYTTNKVITGDGSWVEGLKIPAGWRIPSIDDWQKIKNYYNNEILWNKVKSSYGWDVQDGNNESGLNLLPCGQGSGLPISNYSYRGVAGLYFTSTVRTEYGDSVLKVFTVQNSINASNFSNVTYWWAGYVSLTAAAIRLCKDL